MSGHSKWASIKHKKAAIDAKRGQIFSKISRELTIAAKRGGKDPNANPSLRLAIQKAKEANMPSDNVDRAIKKGTGELPGVVYEECTYEGYGAGGVAIIIEALTDNKNRTTSDIRNILSKRNGNMAGAGAVAWMFTKKGYFVVDKQKVSEEKLMDIVLDAGAEDIKIESETYEIVTDIKNFDSVMKALEKNNIPTQSAELTMVPSSTVKIEGSIAKQVLHLIEALEDYDDIQNVYANFDISDDELEKIQNEE